MQYATYVNELFNVSSWFTNSICVIAKNYHDFGGMVDVPTVLILLPTRFAQPNTTSAVCRKITSGLNFSQQNR